MFSARNRVGSGRLNFVVESLANFSISGRRSAEIHFELFTKRNRKIVSRLFYLFVQMHNNGIHSTTENIYNVSFQRAGTSSTVGFYLVIRTRNRCLGCCGVNRRVCFDADIFNVRLSGKPHFRLCHNIICFCYLFLYFCLSLSLSLPNKIIKQHERNKQNICLLQNHKWW